MKQEQKKIPEIKTITQTYLAFGDSFIKMFIHCKNVQYWKFKGKSIKGLSDPADPERKKIQEIVKSKPGIPVIFGFGQVDLNFIRYYKRIKNERYPAQTFVKYVQWIASLKVETIVLGIFPCPIKKEYIVETLLKYGTNSDKTQENVIFEEFAKTEEKRKKANLSISKECQKHNLKFIDLFPTDELDQDFIDLSPTTVHLRYVPCLNLLQQHISLKLNENIEEEQARYQQQKLLRMKLLTIQ